jgi:hypothetical protein
MRVSEKDLAKFQANSGRAAPATPKKQKYSNVRVTHDGIKFDSKLEGNRYLELKMLKAGNQVEWFIMQAPFHLPGGIIARVDFLIKWRTTLLRPPVITLEDCKGDDRKGVRGSTDNRVSINKRKQIQALYGMEVELVTSAGR